MKRIFDSNRIYFDSPFKLPRSIVDRIPCTPGISRSGRKKLTFDKSSAIVKRRKTAKLRSQYQTDELVFATHMKLREDGRGDAAFIVQQATQTTPTRAVKMVSAIQQSIKTETAKITLSEMEYVQNQIDNLKPIILNKNDRTIRVSCNMLLTMVDGKAINSLTETKSTQSCYLCGATPKEMNEIDRVRTRVVENDRCQYGLSTLHAWIRFFEYFVHLSYKLDIKKWQVRGDAAESVKLRKKLVQQKFKIETGLLVDRPRSGGAGK